MATITTYLGPNGTGGVGSVTTIKWNCSNGTVVSVKNEENAAGDEIPVKASAVEFYNASLDHYFVTADAAEIDALDSSRTSGWKRTNQSFNVYPNPVAGASPVYRFYIPPEFGNSHFISASPNECTIVRASFPSYVLESSSVFYVALPDAQTGACASGTTPVFRLWNRRADSNHRYTGDPATRGQMLARGYTSEGYGNDGVAMCSPN